MSRKANEIELANRQWQRYVRARDAGHIEYKRLAKKCEAFYMGEQWAAEDLAKLAETKRPALTFNQILPTVNTILGEQARKRADIKFLPREDADEKTAEVLTKLFLQIFDQNNFDYKESQVFEDGIIQERGYFDVRMNFDENLRGDIEISVLNPLDVIIDPDAEDYDPRTWNEVFITKWMSIDDIELQFGKKKAKEVAALGYSNRTFGYDSVLFDDEERTGTFGESESVDNALTSIPAQTDVETRTIRRVRVVERQYRKISRVDFFVDPETGDMEQVPDSMSARERKAFARQNGYKIIKKAIKRIRWTITADHVVLHDDWSPYKHFTVVPYFPYFRRGKPMGVVRNLLDPQEHFNKVSSQELHIVNSTANSGWQYEQGALLNMTDEELAARGAETGLVLVRRPGAAPIEKIPPNQIPTGLDRIGMKSAEAIKRISGISDAMLGMESPEMSGRALENNLARGLVQVQKPFDNLDRTRKILAEIMLGLVQEYYTEPRLIRVINPMRPDEPPQEMMINQPDPATNEILNNVTVGKYDVVIQSMPARGNFYDSQFAEALALRQAGVMIPDHAMIEYSQLARKQELAQEVKQLTGLGEPSEADMQMQQLQMQQLQLQIAELQAKIQKLQSEAALNQAKAQDTVTDSDDRELEVLKLRTQLQMKLAELSTKMDIANMQAEAGKLREFQGQIGRYNQTQSVKKFD